MGALPQRDLSEVSIHEYTCLGCCQDFIVQVPKWDYKGWSMWRPSIAICPKCAVGALRGEYIRVSMREVQ